MYLVIHGGIGNWEFIMFNAWKHVACSKIRPASGIGGPLCGAICMQFEAVELSMSGCSGAQLPSVSHTLTP